MAACNQHTYIKCYEMSTRQVAKKLGISARQVERIERKALEKIRKEFEKRGVASINGIR